MAGAASARNGLRPLLPVALLWAWVASGRQPHTGFAPAVQAPAVGTAPENHIRRNAPSYGVFIGDFEVGAAAWEKRTQDKRPCLSVELANPSLMAPLFAPLFAGEGDGHDRVRSRRTRSD